MNKGDIRARILEQVDWSPDQSASFRAKVDRLINRAYQQLSLEAPYLFFENTARIYTEPDVVNTSDTSDRLRVGSGGAPDTQPDSYVLTRTVATADITSGTVTDWDLGRDWGGRTIEVTKTDGTKLRREVRELWETVDGANSIQHISIDIPWPNNSDTAMEYRIFTREYVLPPDIVELRSARIWGDRGPELDVESQYDMERYDYIDYQGQQSGRPQSLFRGPHKQIDAPTMPPEIAIMSEVQDPTDNEATDPVTLNWIGPDPIGSFEYCFTYCIGNLDWNESAEHMDTPIPRWESAPSPISELTHVMNVGEYVRVTVPNMDHIQNYFKERTYDPSATAAASPPSPFTAPTTVRSPLRQYKSGYWIRLYVRRKSAVTTIVPAMSGTSLESRVENTESFYLLDYFNPTTRYKHTGQIPDYERRLKKTHGYQTVRFNPMPDERYEIDCRVLQRPQELLNDTDAPRIHEEAVQALVDKSLVYFYELQGSLELSQNAERRYAQTLHTLTKRYAMIPRLRPTKKFARVRRPTREVRVRYKE